MRGGGGAHFFVGFSQNTTDCFSGQPFSGLGRRRWRHVSAPLFLRALLLPPPRPSQMRSPHAMLAVELVHSLHFFFLQAHWFRKLCSDCQLHSFKKNERERERERETHTHTHTHRAIDRRRLKVFFFLFFNLMLYFNLRDLDGVNCGFDASLWCIRAYCVPGFFGGLESSSSSLLSIRFRRGFLFFDKLFELGGTRTTLVFLGRRWWPSSVCKCSGVYGTCLDMKQV
jgi:hypothetical protein